MGQETLTFHEDPDDREDPWESLGYGRPPISKGAQRQAASAHVAPETSAPKAVPPRLAAQMHARSELEKTGLLKRKGAEPDPDPLAAYPDIGWVISHDEEHIARLWNNGVDADRKAS